MADIAKYIQSDWEVFKSFKIVENENMTFVFEKFEASPELQICCCFCVKRQYRYLYYFTNKGIAWDRYYRIYKKYDSFL